MGESMEDGKGGFTEGAGPVKGLGGSAFDYGFIGKGKGRVLRLLECERREGLGMFALREASTVS